MNQPQPEESEPETRWWELDLRSLAVFRIALGSFVLLTLASFWGDTVAFFTDQGVLPRDTLVNSPFVDLWLSFHMGAGGWSSQVFLNGLLGLFALGLILGWRTPWMVAGCWTLLNSLQARNPFIGDRGDLELSLMLFWAFFLPLGARWSLDARAGRPPFGRWRGVAAAALVTQFGLIYLFAAYYKNGVFWLTRGDGLEHSLISPLFATDTSLWLAEAFQGYLRLGNYAVIAGELFVGLLLFCPWSVSLVRTVSVAMLVGFHLLVALFFQLGLFPWIGAVLPLALLPKEFWSGWGRRVEAWGDRCMGAGGTEEPSRRWQALRTTFVAFALALAVASNFLSTPAGQTWEGSAGIHRVSEALRLSQHWDLFSPIPPYYGTFRLATTGADGQERMLFEGPPTREKPDLDHFPGHRWRMLMIATMYHQFEVIRPGVVRVLAQRFGVDVAKQGKVDYSFWVQLPNDKGELQPPVQWSLWRWTAEEVKP